jgi:hypothetical protein
MMNLLILLTFAAVVLAIDIQNNSTVPSELTGIWMGDEMVIASETESDPLCSQVLINNENLNSILYWISLDGACKADNDVNQRNGRIKTKDYLKGILLEEVYIEHILGWKCLASEYCTDEFVKTKDSEALNDMEVKYKGCGQFYAKDLTRIGQPDTSPYVCYTYQTALVERTKGNDHQVGKKYVVNTVTYSSSDSWETLECPTAATYGVKKIYNVGGDGSIRMFNREPGVDVNLKNPCTWSCFDDTEGICDV